MTVVEGAIRKMRTELHDTVQYSWVSGDTTVPLNSAIGHGIRLSFSGQINCVHCHRLTKKSFNQGYCYPCFRKLAQCDTCIVKPELCHYDQGTCREPEWGDTHCNVEHVVYLANTSALKVGITRGSQVPTRWIDQGATQARPIARVATRHLSGLLEIAIGQHVGDKTAWQAMLKGNAPDVDLDEQWQLLQAQVADEVGRLQAQFGIHALQLVEDVATTAITFPVDVWPTKVKAHNLDKTPVVEGTLMGIKGQYLMMDTGVINIRKYGGYTLQLEVMD